MTLYNIIHGKTKVTICKAKQAKLVSLLRYLLLIIIKIYLKQYISNKVLNINNKIKTIQYNIE